MDLEHERPTEREFGPNTNLLRRRILGAVLICLVIGFLSVVVALFGNDNPQSFYGGIYDDFEGKDPSVWWFVLKAGGLASLAIIVPWLASRRWKASPEQDTETS